VNKIKLKKRTVEEKLQPAVKDDNIRRKASTQPTAVTITKYINPKKKKRSTKREQ